MSEEKTPNFAEFLTPERVDKVEKLAIGLWCGSYNQDKKLEECDPPERMLGDLGINPHIGN